jgi:hypothetical protein
MKLAVAIIGGAILMAAIVAAGALTSLGSAGTPAIRSLPPLTTTVRHEDRALERREHARHAREDARRPHHERGGHADRGHEGHHRGRSHGEDD